MNVKERIDFLRKELEDHNHSYYVLDTSIISDFEFDQLMEELLQLEKENPNIHIYAYNENQEEEESSSDISDDELTDLILLGKSIK